VNRAVVGVSLLVLLAGCSGGGGAPETAPPDESPPSTTASAPVPTPSPPPPSPVSIQAVTAAPSAVDPAEFAAVREYTQMFYDGRLDELFDRFTDEMRQVVPRRQLEMIRDHAVETYGKETRVIGEDTQTKDDTRGFVRWARFDKTEDVIELQWFLKPDDRIAGFFIRPAKRQGETAQP